jgi:hypothetical protein
VAKRLGLRLPLRDTIALSTVSGALGTLIMYCLGFPLYITGVSKSIYMVYSIELFVKPNIAKTVPGIISGALVGILVGMVLAVGLKLLYELVGTDWLWVKAIAYGSTLWFFWVGLTRNLLDISSYLNQSLVSNFILLMQSILWSVATTYFMLRLGGGARLLEKRDED